MNVGLPVTIPVPETGKSDPAVGCAHDPVRWSNPAGSDVWVTHGLGRAHYLADFLGLKVCLHKKCLISAVG